MIHESENDSNTIHSFDILYPEEVKPKAVQIVEHYKSFIEFSSQFGLFI